MTAPSLASDSIDLAAAHRHIDSVLGDFLEAKTRFAVAHGLPEAVPRALRGFLDAGGKRLRPLLCVIGWHAAGGGEAGAAPVIRTAAALELFHAFALVHDDVMDDSPTRRGRPTVHRAFAEGHPAPRQHACTAEKFGQNAAILLGDLALVWADELIHTAGLTKEQLTRVLPLVDAMRSEVMYGQYLDVSASGRPTTDVAYALRTIRYKTAKYTVERPLHIGAALAGGDDRLLGVLSRFALPLGEAFQLRDDLLGVFGDPCVTGKSHLDDLREGKHTVLVALALRDAAPHHAERLRHLLGRDDLGEAEAALIRSILTVTGARTHVEGMIARRHDQCTRLLARPGLLPAEVAAALRHLADTATRRTS
ncbi:polyprenyl synthetase family protein [Streptomyces sp. NPDC047071]|uniref:polyprenyl synthetase family protein n=1 Tax=Streptomyces sp. NPDC047071 TaxID=3154808 RepID=UPI003452ABBA